MIRFLVGEELYSFYFSKSYIEKLLINDLYKNAPQKFTTDEIKDIGLFSFKAIFMVVVASQINLVSRSQSLEVVANLVNAFSF